MLPLGGAADARVKDRRRKEAFVQIVGHSMRLKKSDTFTLDRRRANFRGRAFA